VSGAEQAAAPDATGRRPLPRGFVSLWSTVVLDLLGFGIVLPILPLYVRDLGATPIVIGLVLSAYSAAQLVGAPVLGRLSDRRGRRAVIVVSLVGSAVGHLVTGLAGSVAVIVAARAFDGFSGGSLSIAHAAVADLAPPEDRPRLFGMLGAGIAIGFVAGPALGSLAARGGVHLPFFIAAGLCGANAVTAWWRLSGLPRPVPDGDGGPAAAAGGGRAGGWTLLVPSSPLGRTLVASLVLTVGFSGFESTFGLLGQERVGLTVGTVGLVFAGVGVVLSVVQVVLVKRAVRAWGAVRTARTAAVANLVGFAVLVPAGGWLGLVPSLVLLTVGQGLLSPSLSTVVSALAPPERRGAVFGVQQAVAAGGRIVGPLLALGLFGLAVPSPYVAGALLALAGLVALRGVTLDDASPASVHA
jgi:DHA1 family tetracycline resistance protein-like MFS transporter